MHYRCSISDWFGWQFNCHLPDISTFLNDLSSLANSLSLCLDSFSIFAPKPGNRFVPGAKDHFIPWVSDLFSPDEVFDGLGRRTFSTNFHRTVNWRHKLVIHWEESYLKNSPFLTIILYRQHWLTCNMKSNRLNQEYMWHGIAYTNTSWIIK